MQRAWLIWGLVLLAACSTPTATIPTPAPTMAQTIAAAPTAQASKPTAPAPTAAPEASEPTGMIAVATKRAGAATSDIYLFPANGGTPQRVSRHAANDYAPAWSPDGTRIAFLSDRDGGPGLYITNTTGTTLTQLATGTSDAPITSAAWSPDGQTVVFSHNCTLQTVRSDGSNTRTLLEPASGQDACFSAPSYAPNGETIVFAATVDSNRSAIFTISANGGAPTQLTDDVSEPGSEQTPVFSPDGAQIAFVSKREGEPHIYIANADGTNARRLSTVSFEETNPAWSPDSRWIACNATFQSGNDVVIVPASATVADAAQIQSLSMLSPADSAYGNNAQPAWQPVRANSQTEQKP